VSGAVLHSLPSGFRFDISNRTLIPPVTVLKDRVATRAEAAGRRLRRMAREMAAEGADSFVIDRRRRRGAEPEASE